MASEKQHLIRTPDIAELRAFCVAADLGTLGRAAIRLQISQPALSKRLRGLEAVAGTTLLERSSSGVTLTAAGRRLYPEARRLLDQAEIVEGLLASAQSDPDPIRLAASHTIAEFHLPGELVAYHADRAQHAPVELTIANSVVVRRMVAEGRASIGITAADPKMAEHDDLEVFHLLDDEVVVAVPEGHPWYRRKKIPQRLLLSTPLITRDPEAHNRRCVETALAERGLHLAPPLIEVGSTAVAKREALERSEPVLLSALALDEARDRLHRRPVEGLSFPREFVVVCRTPSSLPRPDRDFLAFLRRGETGGPGSD